MKKRLRICYIAVLVSAIVATLISISAAIFNEVKALSSTDESVYYTVTLAEGEKIRCYKLKDETGRLTTDVSVAWLWTDDDSNPMGSSLTIPSTVRIGNDDCTVKEVFRGGFRSTTFTTINLPQTVEKINEEAFAYCIEMTSFSIPYLVSKIAPSTFMDCKNLEAFYYTGLEDISDPSSAIIKKLGNTTITEIGDHAFDNCKKLKGLYFPSSLVTIGESAFQRCETIQSLFFPSANAYNTNKIRVGDYAFADCPLLKTVYFEENLEYFGKYCFVNDKEDLTFTYTGQSEPTSFADHWRDKNITTSNNNVYDFLPFGQQKIHFDDEYPGLIFTNETGDQYLDCAGPNPTSDVIKVIENSVPYVKISGFQEPFVSLPNYYDIDTKTLTIPNFVGGKPVKSIGQNAFGGQPFRSVIFNANLVQIQNRAFYGCNDIESLNFMACENLKEISYEIFQSTCPELYSEKAPTEYTKYQVYNDKLHSIALPNCLEFIGDSAFYNFTNLTGGINFKATHPDQPSQLKIIGDFAFSVHRTKKSSFSPSDLIDIVLPNSLDDRYATGYVNTEKGINIPAAKFYHPYNPYDGKKRIRRCAIGRFAFENQDIIGTLTMEPATAEQKVDMDYTTSFMSNVTIRCNNLYKFQTNENLYLVGSDMFKLVPNLKEVFFYTEKAQYRYENCNGAAFPWGIRDDCAFPGNATDSKKYENGIFSGVSDESGYGNYHTRQDTVVYISGSKAPGLLDDPTKYRKDIYVWNRDATETYRTELDYDKGNGIISNKKIIPTFYNSDWEGSDANILYWKPGENGGTFRPKTSSDPNYSYTLSVDEYAEGYISIVPSSNKAGGYQIAKYFTDGEAGHYSEEIDLTTIPTTYGDISSKLYAIAPSAFAAASSKIPGLYFILPETILSIGERAFFRKGTINNAVRIVTTKVGDTIQVPSGSTGTYEDYVENYNTDVGGYCILPSSVTNVEENSFFNNNFKTIVLNSNLARLGASAFATKQYENRSTSLSFTPAAGSKFAATNDGLYYTEFTNKKTLVYQVAGTQEETLTIDSGTKAVAFRAAVGSNYGTVTIPAGLTTFYGGAFANSKMKTINGSLSDIEYICARTLSGDTEIYDKYDGSYPFDNYDITPVTKWAETDDRYINNARNGAFKDCKNLETLYFNEMTSLKAIGLDAFSGCTKLKNVSSESYTMYDYTGKSSGQAATALPSTTVVMDFSKCLDLRKIQSKAFNNVKTCAYTILPTTVGKSTTAESLLTIENEGTALPHDSKHLIGETYHQAGINHRDDNLKPSTHYGRNALGNLNRNYWRFYVEDLPDGLTIEDYLASDGTQSSISDEQYWTIYDGKYYLLKGYDQAKAFYNAVNNPDVAYTPGQALTY